METRNPIRDKPPRLTIELSEEHAFALNKIFEHGERKTYFTAVVEATIDIYNRFGKEALYLMVTGRVSLLETLCKGISNVKQKGA